MDSSREVAFVQRQVMLGETNYGHWKVKMRHNIRKIDEDAWTSVETGWAEPTVKDEDGNHVLKAKEKWSDAEKRLSKMNSSALSVIYDSLNEDQFKLIQGCETAKEAWDTLQRYYEGTTSVKRSRLDSLASQFENLRMEVNEKVSSFSARISAIANEACVLGKKYKDKKLVKKFLRCLPQKFSAHKSAMTVSLNTDTMSFREVVGMMKAHEMELEPQILVRDNGVALAASNEKQRFESLENSVSMLVKNFNNSLKRVDKGNRKFHGSSQSENGERSTRRTDVQCHECQGIGHFRSDCPTIKKREGQCSECKGYGHSKFDCVSGQGRRNRSYVSLSDSESESEDEDNKVKGFVAFPAMFQQSDSSDSESESEADKQSSKSEEDVVESESDSEEEEDIVVLKREFRVLYENCLKTSKENVQLMQEVIDLKGLLVKEQEKSASCEKDLAETKKKILMLNSGTKDLEKILTMGRPAKVNYGLGYQGDTSMGETDFVKFVKGNNTEPVPATFQKKKTEEKNPHGCYHCGKTGHVKKYCYQFQATVRRLISQDMHYPFYNDSSRVYVRKSDLYQNQVVASEKYLRTEKKNLAASRQHQGMRNAKQVEEENLLEQVAECFSKSAKPLMNTTLKMTNVEAGLPLISTLWMCFLTELCQSSRGRKGLGSSISN